MDKDNIIRDVASYYSDKLAEHGDTPRGVDWNGKDSQSIRFGQLSKIINSSTGFSINDIGCGYGALQDYLSVRYTDYQYIGIDVSESMIQAARVRYSGVLDVKFIHSSEPEEIADYGVASGIFNVCLGVTEDKWWDYLEGTLDVINRSSRIGFSFNCLTSYSDKEKMRDGLFYANPGKVFDLCKQKFSRNVALLHDYDLYEFTVLVRK